MCCCLVGGMDWPPFDIHRTNPLLHKSGKYESPIVLHAHAEYGELRFEMDGSFVHNGSPLWPDSMNIDRSMSLDFGAFEHGKLTSRVTRFYAIDVPTNFPIVSLATKPANLWDDEIGINVRGFSLDGLEHGFLEKRELQQEVGGRCGWSLWTKTDLSF